MLFCAGVDDRDAMRRRLFNLAAAVSLLLLVCVVVLWVRSYWVADQFLFRGTKNTGWIASDRGTMLLFHRARVSGEDDGTWMFRQTRPGQFQVFLARSSIEYRWLQFRPADWRRVPVSITSPPPLQTQSSATLTVALVANWVLCLFGAILPAYWLVRHRRARRRARLGLCPTCGYDLRGTPDRCPECGRPANRGCTATA